MSHVAEQTISALIPRQLPDFVRAGSPQYQRFIELYYQWLEDESAGNTVYHILKSGEYRDIDETLDPFIRLFKNELLPYFPEKTALDLVKILKGAREFYVKKGSEDSVKWLFRVLFGEDVEIYYPKQQVLITSHGKWKLPQAFLLTLSPANQGIDVNLLEKHKGTGSISKATCIIESANRTIDRTFGNEIVEIYVSNVEKEYVNGEFLEIPYIDEFGDERIFSERIIGSISNILVDSNIRTDPQQKRRGLLYNVGDPVVVFGGLAQTAEANDAVAVVGNVTVGSIEGLQVLFGGYGYRTYTNTEAIVFRSEGDDPNANQSTDIRVAGVSTLMGNTSQDSFREVLSVDKMPIEFLGDIAIDSNYAVFTQNNRNIVLNVNNDGDPWYNDEWVYANSDGSLETANFKAQILTANTGWSGGPLNIILYNVSNTVPLTTPGFLVGTDTLLSTQSGSKFNVTSVVAESLDANSSSEIRQALVYENIETGAVALYNILNGGFGFRSAPVVETSSYFDTFWSENFAYGTQGKRDYRQPMGAFGQIAHIWIDNGGIGYANGDTVIVTGRGYGFSGNVVVNGIGTIVSVNIHNRGEGYYEERGVSVSSVGGTGAVLTAYGFGEGVEVAVETGAIGRVRDVRMISRGFDYIDEPLVSFKVVDMVILGVADTDNLIQGERVYQGATLETATFQGIVKSYTRSTRLLRLFNYSGNSFGNFNASLPFTSQGGVSFTVDTSARVPAPSQYPIAVQISGLPNPYFYGNGKARGIAEFYQGLVKFPGFYLNTDGFPSSDKKLQDGRVYQNYSYVIESERNLSDYRKSMRDIVHPSGMLMLSRSVTRSKLVESIKSDEVIYLNRENPVGAMVNIANSYNAVVTGIGTDWTTSANVGDMFYLIDDTYAGRSQAKMITAVNSDTSLNVESNFTFVGAGRMTLEAGSDQAEITAPATEIVSQIIVGDKIRVNTGNVEVFTVSVVAGNVLTLNTTAGNSVSNAVYVVVPDYITANYDYDIITVE